jgi:phosphosulfolactate phosphohydrolase-like enzyme
VSSRTFVIDSIPESAGKYRQTHAIVAIDVFRATTVIVTALAGGHPIYPVATVSEALASAARLSDALLVGEQAGVKPAGFALNNSPAAVARLTDLRPIVLLTSAGTQLLAQARGASSIYVACLRNISATAKQLVLSHPKVALIGAGTRGLPRAEDQLACVRIAQLLLASGYEAENSSTEVEVETWRDVGVQELRTGPSADYLRDTNQTDDLDFVVTHVDDVDSSAVFNGQQVSLLLRTGETRLAAEA